MPELPLLLVIVVVIAWSSTSQRGPRRANAIATIVSTKVLSPRRR
jgi:hypothetical protein